MIPKPEKRCIRTYMTSATSMVFAKNFNIIWKIFLIIDSLNAKRPVLSVLELLIVLVSGACSWLKDDPILWKKYVVGSYGCTDVWLWNAIFFSLSLFFCFSDWWHIRSVLKLGLKDKSTTLSEDIEEMSGEPVWKVDDSDRGIMDLHEKPAMTIIQDIYNYQLN